MILGRDLLNDLGLILDFKNKSMEWDQAKIAMQSYLISQDTTTTAIQWLLDAVDSDLADNSETPTRASDEQPNQSMKPTTKKRMLIPMDTNPRTFVPPYMKVQTCKK